MGMMKALAAVAALISATNAHMVITSPIPLGKSVLNNSPLAADGSDFPCKSSVSGWDNIADGGGNVMAVGESNTLSFMGGATHGGGSCQVSITSDTPPTKNSKWMVIKSIEGNCPVDSSETDNTSGDPSNTKGLNTFQYSIPDHPDIPAGKNYTLAWSWNNRIGNREFYMNCASVQLEAAKKKRYVPENYKRQSSSLPAMFVANIGAGCTAAGCANGCTVPELANIKYPDPGSDVTTGQGLTFTSPSGSCGAVSDSSSSSSSSTSGGGSGSNSSSPGGSGSPNGPGSNGGAPSASSATAVSQTAGGSFATNNPGSGAPAGSSTPAATSAPAAPAPAPAQSGTGVASAPVPAGTSSSTGTGTGSGTTSASGTQSGPCTTEGEWSCAADGKSYQRCASGRWSVPMSMSAGMHCTPGTSSTLSQSAGSGKRDRVIRRRPNRARTPWE